MMMCKGPFLVVIHRDGLAMVNVLHSHVVQCGFRLAGRRSIGYGSALKREVSGAKIVHQD